MNYKNQSFLYCTGRGVSVKNLSKYILEEFPTERYEDTKNAFHLQGSEIEIEIEENDTWLDDGAEGFLAYQYMIEINSNYDESDLQQLVKSLYNKIDKNYTVFVMWDFEEEYPEMSID